MKKLSLSVLTLALVLSAGVTRAFGQATPSSPPADTTAPSYDMKAQAMLDLDGMNKKFVSLAEALPQDKFTWHPSEDSRTFAEVFLHVASERYLILGLMGAAQPAGFDQKTFEKSTTDKAKIIEQLNKTMEYTNTTIGAMTNAEFAKLLPKLGPQANAGDVVYILVSDNHEHLGQLIAYARENGIVPPWTIAAQKAAADRKAKQAQQADPPKQQ